MNNNTKNCPLSGGTGSYCARRTRAYVSPIRMNKSANLRAISYVSSTRFERRHSFVFSLRESA
jgi:hypothetical protein